MSTEKRTVLGFLEYYRGESVVNILVDYDTVVVSTLFIHLHRQGTMCALVKTSDFIALHPTNIHISERDIDLLRENSKDYE